MYSKNISWAMRWGLSSRAAVLKKYFLAFHCFAYLVLKNWKSKNADEFISNWIQKADEIAALTQERLQFKKHLLNLRFCSLYLRATSFQEGPNLARLLYVISSSAWPSSLLCYYGDVMKLTMIYDGLINTQTDVKVEIVDQIISKDVLLHK